MPSETIHDSTGIIDIRVSWGNDESGTVQVVSQAATREGVLHPTDRIVNILNDWLIEAHMPLVDLDELRKELSYEPHFDGWWATLNSWSECNRLIKVLQRARDRAFGSPA